VALYAALAFFVVLLASVVGKGAQGIYLEATMDYACRVTLPDGAVVDHGKCYANNGWSSDGTLRCPDMVYGVGAWRTVSCERVPR